MPGTFTVCPSRNLARHLKGFFFFFKSEIGPIGSWYKESGKQTKKSLRGIFFKVFSLKLKWSYVPRGKEKHSEAVVEGFAKTFQRHTDPNLELRNLLFFSLVEHLLPLIKK